MKFFYWLCLILIIIGALNWGMVGLFDFNLVAFLFGPMSIISKVIYVVVGIAGLIMIYLKAKKV